VFIAAGMGGGTGTGAAPVIAEAARRKGVLTVGVVTKPFLFEGTRRMRAADAGIEELQKHVDTLIVIPNQNLFLVAKAETTFKEAFQLADEVLQQGVRSITDLMVMPGLINLDFADVRSVMQEMGKAMMGTGEGEGENRALEAAERAIANPLLDGVSMAGARGVIISIIGGEDMKLLEVDEAANHIRELVDEDANIIWGSAFNPDLSGRIRVSVVATGIDASGEGVVRDTQALSLAGSRAPKRPVLELPEEDAAIEEEATDDFTLDTSSFRQLDDDDEYDEDSEEEDVDGIVDPLAGLRNDDQDEGDSEESELAAHSDDEAYAQAGEGGFSEEEEASDDDWGDAPAKPKKAPLDLTGEFAEPNQAEEPQVKAQQDELLLDADRLMEEDQPVQAQASGRRRGLVSGAAAGGSTLFERMANLSRGSADADEEDEDEDGEDDSGSLSIPRFLGRQNNQ
jgi:cell division protein FtsZ